MEVSLDERWSIVADVGKGKLVEVADMAYAPLSHSTLQLEYLPSLMPLRRKFVLEVTERFSSTMRYDETLLLVICCLKFKTRLLFIESMILSYLLSKYC